MFFSVFKHMMASRGFKVSESTTREFFDFVKKVSPWFPEEGSLSLSDWKKIGKDMRKYIQEHGEGELPPQAYPLWLQMRELLSDATDFEGLVQETISMQDEREAKPLNKPACSYGTNSITMSLKAFDEDSSDNIESDQDLDEKQPADKKGKRGSRPLLPRGFQGAVEEARRKGDLTFSFPVVEGKGDEEPVWEPLPLKTLKELQSAVKTSGPSAPYTVQVLDMVASHWLTPHDWHQTAKATLEPGDYVLWRTEYEDRSKQTVIQFAKKRGSKPSMDMLLGTGVYTSPQRQVSIPRDVLEAITTNAVQAWRKLPPPGTKGTTLSGVRQGNEETYQSFISRLEEAVFRMMPPSEGTEILLKQLAWENANALCQDLIRPIRKTGTVQDYVKACVDASPAVVQGMAYAAAMKGENTAPMLKRLMVKEGKKPPSPLVLNVGNQDMCKSNVQETIRGTPIEEVYPQEHALVARKAGTGKVSASLGSTRMEHPLMGKRRRRAQ